MAPKNLCLGQIHMKLSNPNLCERVAVINIFVIIDDMFVCGTCMRFFFCCGKLCSNSRL